MTSGLTVLLLLVFWQDSALDWSAKANGEVIYSRDVERETARALKGKKVDDATKAALHKETLQLLIDQRLIAQGLTRDKLWVSGQELELAESRLRKQLEARGQSWDDFLKKHELHIATFRRQLEWQEGWSSYLKRQLTDENIEKFFDDHRMEFDGTRLNVSQILLPVDKKDGQQDEASLKAALERAREIRAEIENKKLSFAQAAEKYSTGPSAKQGGELGLIGRREPMPDTFSRAAFALKKYQVGEPVVTAFGVHLIQWTDSTPGKKTWFDSRAELEQEMTQFLFRRIADRERRDAKIELP